MEEEQESLADRDDITSDLHKEITIFFEQILLLAE